MRDPPISSFMLINKVICEILCFIYVYESFYFCEAFLYIHVDMKKEKIGKWGNGLQAIIYGVMGGCPR